VFYLFCLRNDSLHYSTECVTLTLSEKIRSFNSLPPANSRGNSFGGIYIYIEFCIIFKNDAVIGQVDINRE